MFNIPFISKNKNNDSSPKPLKCHDHYFNISIKKDMDFVYISDTYKKEKLDSSYPRHAVNWRPDIQNIDILFDKIMGLEDSDNETSWILGSEDSLNLNNIIEPLQWVIDNVHTKFIVEFSIHKFKEKYLNQGKVTYLSHIEIRFCDKNDLMSFKMRYYDEVDDLEIKI